MLKQSTSETHTCTRKSKIISECWDNVKYERVNEQIKCFSY